MEIIEGPNLGEVVAEWLMEPGVTTVGVAVASLSEIVDFFMGVLSALARVHARGVYHRDIKPANITITSDGVAKLLDFGIARDTHKAGVTRAGLVPGTPAFMSPEQSLDDPVGATSDLFSLGLTLYRVLAGHSIYSTEIGDETKSQQVIRHLWQLHANHGEFRFEFPEELPPAFHEVIRRACRIDPAARYQTALEMREALARALASPHQATAEAPPRAPRREPPRDDDEAAPRSRRGLVIAAASVAGVALLGGLLAVYIQRPKSGSDAAGQLLERTRLRSQQVTKLVGWLETRADEPARAVAAQASGDLRRFSEDLEQAATDVKDGYADLALRELDRAEQGFATLCDRFTSDYLEGARASAEGAARDEYARVTDDARSLAPEATAKLDGEFARLSAEIGTRGCERADGMRARIEAAALVRELAAGVIQSVEEALPKTVETKIAQAEAAGTRAREAAITNEHYVERLREGDEALSRARAAQTEKDWKAALAAAELATASLERTALIGPARGSGRLRGAADAIEALPARCVHFESAQRASARASALRAPSRDSPGPTARLEATPVVEVGESRRCLRAARESARTRRVEQSELDARAKFRAAKFDEAAAIYTELEARCGQILVAAAERKSREQASRREKSAEAQGASSRTRAPEKVRRPRRKGFARSRREDRHLDARSRGREREGSVRGGALRGERGRVPQARDRLRVAFEAGEGRARTERSGAEGVPLGAHFGNPGGRSGLGQRAPRGRARQSRAGRPRRRAREARGRARGLQERAR
jgi:hypothetical protein